ncbi:Uridine kinase [Candidatus Fokinia solitaria]|uniref:Uridine kinase n=1 Tax=Candidatus Fokinia solitaria TaxID=1802984 RepID=A0A2U8BRX9_9RICK|nr:uridine kinase [Candidatus Fokinia solitaria]AWD33087.1 Uridine kinase [Candidatus Fokinia solitaria]
MKKCVVIGISGASGSGKSLFASTIIKNFHSSDVSIISEDMYYRSQDHLSLEERKRTNYDHPAAFEHNLLVEHIMQLRDGFSIEAPTYDYVRSTRATTTKLICACSVLIVEGILLLYDEELRNMLDISIYIDTPLDICLSRRIVRDIQERGRTAEGTIKQYQESTRPMFLKYVQPSKTYADIIVPHGGKNEVAVNIIEEKIKSILTLSKSNYVQTTALHSSIS